MNLQYIIRFQSSRSPILLFIRFRRAFRLSSRSLSLPESFSLFTASLSGLFWSRSALMGRRFFFFWSLLQFSSSGSSSRCLRQNGRFFHLLGIQSSLLGFSLSAFHFLRLLLLPLAGLLSLFSVSTFFSSGSFFFSTSLFSRNLRWLVVVVVGVVELSPFLSSWSPISSGASSSLSGPFWKWNIFQGLNLGHSRTPETPSPGLLSSSLLPR